MTAVDNGGWVEQHLDVSGTNHKTNVAGRDLTIFHYDGKDEFFRHGSGTGRARVFPRVMPELVARLADRRVLVLGGDYDDRDTVARQVAWRFAETAAADGGGAAPPVIEWNRSSDFRALQLAMKREPPSVVLLVGILPQDVGYAPERLKDAALEGGHHVVVSTGVPREGWMLDPRPRKPLLWYELDAAGLFAPADVAEELARQLAGLPEPVGGLSMDERGLMLGGVPLERITAALGTPPRVDAFVEQLREHRGAPLDAQEVDALLEAAVNREGRVRTWFQTALTGEERLLALGLAFFDGLFDDQFFAALERWVAHIRESRDPTARAFDYADLATLQPFYRRVESDDGGTKFEVRADDERTCLLRAAWATHRRQVLNALQVLTHLVEQSPYGRGRDGELYGSGGRRAQLRRVVAVALSDVGLISALAVEPALLRLAGDDEEEVQGVAAAAVARWRLHGRHAELFSLLARWQNDAQIRAFVAALVAGQAQEKTHSRDAYIRATIALAVGYAAEYDPPGQLRDELRALVRELAGDGNPLVREHFASFTLPRVTAIHLRQLRPLLRELLADATLAYPVGAALAYAWRTDPAEVEATLDEWHADARAGRGGWGDAEGVETRERLLAALAHTYGELDYDGGGALTAEAGLQRLREILAGERRPTVRHAAVRAVTRQARERFASVEPLLPELLGEMTADEHGEVVRQLTRVYLDQREAQEGAPEHLEVGGRSFPVFTDPPRSLTAVEEAMTRWMADVRHPAAQRIAMRAAVAFVEALDRPLRREWLRTRPRRAQPADRPGCVGPVEPGWYAGWFVPWLATLGAPQHRPVVGGLLAEAVAQNRARPEAVEFVLSRWMPLREGRMAAPATYLASAISWHAFAWIFPLLAGIAILVLLARLF